MDERKDKTNGDLLHDVKIDGDVKHGENDVNGKKSFKRRGTVVDKYNEKQPDSLDAK